jgi:hypothetical protein
MKGKRSDSAHHYLPPCPYSSQCVLLLDELALFGQSNVHNSMDILPDPLDNQDALSVAQLSAHLQTCPTCRAAVAQVRHLRAWQRRGLRDVLAEGELKVPVTTTLIMESIRREQSQSARSTSETRGLVHELSPLHLPETGLQRRTQRRSSVKVRVLLAVVAALLLLASVSLLTRQVALHTQTNMTASTRQRATESSLPASAIPTSVIKSTNWSSVILSARSADGNRQIIENYNPINGKSVQLLPSCCTTGVQIDSIAHNGYNLVYHSFDGQNTRYSFLTGPTYSVVGQASNAVWNTTDQFVYADTSQGLLQLDVSHGTQKRLPVFPHASKLAFARDLGQESFLYFIREQGDGGSDLYRVNIATGLQDLVVAGASSDSFWLDPTGAVVYYTKNAAGQSDIYMVASDGSNRALFFRQNATPVGYASDGSLMMIRQQQDAFALLKAGAQQDETVLANVLPGADALCDPSVAVRTTPICQSSIALAPLGGMLVIEAGYASGNYKLWSIDLPTGKTTQLPLSSGLSHIQLFGWARLLLN